MPVWVPGVAPVQLYWPVSVSFPVFGNVNWKLSVQWPEVDGHAASSAWLNVPPSPHSQRTIVADELFPEMERSSPTTPPR